MEVIASIAEKLDYDIEIHIVGGLKKILIIGKIK